MIDYIRTYTLDKRMETLIKGSGLMGGDGKVRQGGRSWACVARFMVSRSGSRPGMVRLLE
jgi:hypothetical protein